MDIWTIAVQWLYLDVVSKLNKKIWLLLQLKLTLPYDNLINKKSVCPTSRIGSKKSPAHLWTKYGQQRSSLSPNKTLSTKRVLLLTFIDPFLSIKVLQSIGSCSKRTIGSCFLPILKEEKFKKTAPVHHHAPHSNEDRCSPLSSSFTLPQIVNVTSLVHSKNFSPFV